MTSYNNYMEGECRSRPSPDRFYEVPATSVHTRRPDHVSLRGSTCDYAWLLVNLVRCVLCMKYRDRRVQTYMLPHPHRLWIYTIVPCSPLRNWCSIKGARYRTGVALPSTRDCSLDLFPLCIFCVYQVVRMKLVISLLCLICLLLLASLSSAVDNLKLELASVVSVSVSVHDWALEPEPDS